MLILKIDSREQLPLEFRKGAFDGLVTEGLPFADYWAELDGKELPLVFERKSLGDLFGTMTSGYERFKKELERAKWAGAHMVLAVEGSIREVAKGFSYSEFGGDSMLKKLAMLRVRYDLEVQFFGDRHEMARWIEETYRAIERNYEKERKDAARKEKMGL